MSLGGPDREKSHGSKRKLVKALGVELQVLSKLATGFWQSIVAAYKAGDVTQVRDAGAVLLGLLADLDALLGTEK